MRSETLGRKPSHAMIDVLVTALTVYFALSFGIMQTRNTPATIEHSAITVHNSLVS